MTKKEYRQCTLAQKLVYHGKKLGVPVTSLDNPSTVAHGEHLYHISLSFSAKDNSILRGWRLHDNGYSDKNKLYDLPGHACTNVTGTFIPVQIISNGLLR